MRYIKMLNGHTFYAKYVYFVCRCIVSQYNGMVFKSFISLLVTFMGVDVAINIHFRSYQHSGYDARQYLIWNPWFFLFR